MYSHYIYKSDEKIRVDLHSFILQSSNLQAALKSNSNLRTKQKVSMERFSNDYRKTNKKGITSTNHNKRNSTMNQSELLAITGDFFRAREKQRVQAVIGFASHWWKNWREVFQPITKRINNNCVFAFRGHLKNAKTTATRKPN